MTSKDTSPATPNNNENNSTKSQPKIQKPLNWYICKGISYQDGSIFKNGRPPRCYGIRSRVTDPDMLNVLNNEVPQKHWKDKKYISMKKNDFFHACVGTSHFFRLNEKFDQNQKQRLYEKDLARCRAGLDIFSNSKADETIDFNKEDSLNGSFFNEENKVLTDEKILETISKESSDSLSLPTKKNRKLDSIFDDDDDLVDIFEQLKSGGKYAVSLGERTLTEMNKNADFLSNQILNREFPQRFMNASTKVINQFEPTFNNCITFAKKLYKSATETDYDDDDDNSE